MDAVAASLKLCGIAIHWPQLSGGQALGKINSLQRAGLRWFRSAAGILCTGYRDCCGASQEHSAGEGEFRCGKHLSS
jgi:hypothetical protein